MIATAAEFIRLVDAADDALVTARDAVGGNVLEAKVDEADARTAGGGREGDLPRRGRRPSHLRSSSRTTPTFTTSRWLRQCVPLSSTGSLRSDLESREIDSEAIEEAALALVQSSAFFVS
jgi:hypothetical protein